VTDDSGVAVQSQRTWPIGKGLAVAARMPIAPEAPAASFARMSPLGPLIELVVHLTVKTVKDAFGDGSAKVQRPAATDRVESGDERRLGRAAILVDDLFDTLQVSLLRVFAGFDDGFEAWLAAKGAGAILADAMLADVEAEKVEPDIALVCVEGMRDAGFAGFEFESHLSQSGFGTVFEVEEHLEVIAENDEIIGVANNRSGMSSGRSLGAGFGM